MSIKNNISSNFEIKRHQFEIIYAIDTSASMCGEKIESVNNAMHELERLLKEVAEQNSDQVQIYIRIITFGGDQAVWHLEERTRIEDFSYQDINAVRGGRTPMGSAFNLLNQALNASSLPNMMFKPLVVLLSDGWPTDEWKNELDQLIQHSWGRKATKVAIAIGEQADREILTKFTTNSKQVFEANDSAAIIKTIEWTSTIISATVLGEYTTYPVSYMLNDNQDVFSSEQYSTTDSNAKTIVEKANSVLKLYFENKKHESLIESKSFFDEMNIFLFGKSDFSYIPSTHEDELKDSFMEKFNKDSVKIVKYTEFTLAYRRVKEYTKEGDIPEIGYDHNINFIDWFLFENNIIKKRNKKLHDAINAYANQKDLFFQDEKKNKFERDSRSYKFYSSANRAETRFIKDKDLSSALIQTRKAVEQYIKAMYEKEFKQEAPDSPAQCLKGLKKVITKTYSHELWPLIKRGNANAHDCYSTYDFAVIHGLEMLKECAGQINKWGK